MRHPSIRCELGSRLISVNEVWLAKFFFPPLYSVPIEQQSNQAIETSYRGGVTKPNQKKNPGLGPMRAGSLVACVSHRNRYNPTSSYAGGGKKVVQLDREMQIMGLSRA